MTTIAEVVGASPVMPVVIIEDAAHAEPLARALASGGVRVIEVTMRTPAALEAIRRIADAVPEMIVGAGTVLDGDQARAAVDAGSRFLVSPGAAPRLLDELLASDVPVLPGVATVGEALAARERGVRVMKFFPAAAAGGAAYLRAIASPLPDLRFCPTGGIDERSAPEYLALPNVVCVGGSWLAPAAALRAGDWDAVTRLAAVAAGWRAAGLPLP
jgi:2-dehydro-3-deoxyphosphogluconate aldolase/(4S)-4-hydroxy-2-oxoglutarate aldolase